MLRRSFALSTCVALLALAACDCSGGGVDAGPGEDDGGLGTRVDSGTPPGDGGNDRDGGTPGDGGGDTDAGSGPDLGELARKLCEAYKRGEVNAGLHVDAVFPTARCSNTDLLPDVDDDLPLPLGTCGVQDPLREMFTVALTGGRVQIDEQLFADCITAGRAMRAASPSRGQAAARSAGITALLTDATCLAAVTPLVDTPGAPCEQAWDCVAPLRCEAEPIDGTTLSCVMPAQVGERCDQDPVSGDVALRSCRDGHACVLGYCTERLDDGDTCDPLPDSVPCAIDRVCLTTNVCGVPGGVDAPCAADEQCEAALRCNGATCFAPAALLDDGEVCLVDADCAGFCSVCRPDSAGELRCQDRASETAPCAVTDHCRAGLFCQVVDGGSCVPLREHEEPCGLLAPCADGFACSSLPAPLPPPPADAGPADAGAADAGPMDAGALGFVCRNLPGLGQGCQRTGPYFCAEGACVGGVCVAGDFDDPCIVDADCSADGLCVSGVCTRKPREDAPCTSDGRCDDGLVCQGQRCLPLPGAGAPCTASGLCDLSAFCADVPDAGAVCEATRAPGVSCTDDEQCEHGRCLGSGTCGAKPASCQTTRETFAQLVGLSLLVPLGRRLRRRRRA